MLNLNKCVLTLLAIIVACSGCSSVSGSNPTNSSAERNAQAVVFVSSYFEEPETRDFIAEPELLSINDSQLSVIKVSGKLNDGEYPMDTFAVDAASGIKNTFTLRKKTVCGFPLGPLFCQRGFPRWKVQS